jgi:hypothetical protein
LIRSGKEFFFWNTSGINRSIKQNDQEINKTNAVSRRDPYSIHDINVKTDGINPMKVAKSPVSGKLALVSMFRNSLDERNCTMRRIPEITI